MVAARRLVLPYGVLPGAETTRKCSSTRTGAKNVRSPLMSQSKTPMLVRTTKALLTFLVGLFALLVGLDNIIDYGTNFGFVQHVLSMDTTLAGNKLMWRAITSEWVHHLAYALIIAAELATGGSCVAGAWRLFQTRSARAQAFNEAKEPAIAGLVAGFGVFFFGFLVVGGEWFQMWQSQTWNGQEAAFRSAMFFGLVLIFVAAKDDDIGHDSLR
jgi:predicted small integral membrane protein